MESRKFVFDVEQAPKWFESYQSKIIVKTRGVRTVFVYDDNDKTNCSARKFNVGDTIHHDDLYLW